MRVGSGPFLHHNELMLHDMDTALYPEAAAFTSMSGDRASWQIIRRAAPNYIKALTSGVEDYGKVWLKPILGQDSISFSVEACEEVKIGLSSEMDTNNKPSYEVVIGGLLNSITALRKASEVWN